MAGLEVWRWWEYLRYINVDTVYRPVRSSLLNSHQRPYDVLIIFIYLIYWSRKMNCKGKSSGSGSLVLYSDCCIQCFINITQTRSDLFKAVVVILCLVDAFHHSCFSYQMWLNCHKENSIILLGIQTLNYNDWNIWKCNIWLCYCGRNEASTPSVDFILISQDQREERRREERGPPTWYIKCPVWWVEIWGDNAVQTSPGQSLQDFNASSLQQLTKMFCLSRMSELFYLAVSQYNNYRKILIFGPSKLHRSECHILSLLYDITWRPKWSRSWH